MKKSALWIQTTFSVVIFFVLLFGLICGFAGKLHYWQGIAYWVAFCLPTLFITVFFLQYDPALIERRIKPVELRPKQIVGQSIAALLFFFGIIAFPAWDYRMRWSRVPGWLSIVADVLVVVGFVIVFFVFKANTFTSRAVEHIENQRTITTGPYAVVRHPMYSGATLIILATPLALGSYWGVIFSMLMIFIIVLRLLDEEILLKKELKGYCNYCETQKYRLIPYIW